MAIRRDSSLFIVFLGLLSALPPLSIDMGLPGIPAIEGQFPAAAGRGALTLSLFLAGFAVSPLICGPLADRFGRRPTLLVGLLAFTLAATAAGFAPDFTSLLAFRLVQGVAAGACAILPLAIVRDLFQGSRAMALLSQVTAVLGIAPMAAPVLGSVVLGFGDWRLIYITQGLLGLILFVAALGGFHESLPVERRRPLTPRQLIGSYRMVLSDRAFLGFSLVYAFGFATMFSYIASSAGVLMNQLHLPDGQFALLFGLTSCGVMVGSLLSGRLSQQGLSPAWLMSRGLTLMLLAVGLLFAVVATGSVHIYTISPLTAVVIFCFGLIGPSTNHEAIHALGHVAGAASGVMRFLQMALGALASALVALLESNGSPAMTMALLMLGGVTLAGLTYILTRRHQRAAVAQA